MNAQVTVETINPKTAREWLLNKIEEQRPIRENHVHRLAAEIKTGNFRLTSDAIVLLKGRLANGQHRLSGVVMADKSAQFIVMRTTDEELYKVIDSGQNRTVADVLGPIIYAKSLAAATRTIVIYDQHGLTVAGENISNGRVITRSSILDYIARHQVELTEQAAYVHKLYGETRIVSCTIATAFLHIASREKPVKAREFITHVYDGSVIDASKDFRDRMIKEMGSKHRLRQSYVMALLIKAWRSYLNGTRPGSLKMSEGEIYPEI